MFLIFLKRLEFSSRTGLSLAQRVNGFCIHFKATSTPAVQEFGMRSHSIVWLCLLLLLSPWSALAQQDPFFNDFRSADEEAFFDDPYQDMADDPLLQRDFQLEPQPDAAMEDPLPAESTPAGDPFETPVQEGDQYLDEGTFSDDTESALRFDLLNQRRIADSDRRNLTSNVGYGAGTGLMIGGWFTFLRPGTSRDQFRTIGTSTVVGGIIGALMGSRSFWSPTAPRAVGQQGLPSGPVALIEPSGWQLAYTWSF